jgi:hypothetical protein
MAEDEETFMSGLYIGLGLLAAAGIGYAVWRWALDDETKNKARDFMQDTATQAKRAVRDAKGRIHIGGE